MNTRPSRRNRLAACLAALLLPACGEAGLADQLPGAHLRFPSAPLQRDVPRIGINMGSWSFYGSDQIMSNVLKNAGFEGRIDRIVLQARQPDIRFVEDDAQWTGAPDHFWDGADFEVVTGAGAGLKGRVSESWQSGDYGYPQYLLDRQASGVQAGDAITLTRRELPATPTHWWVSPADKPYLSLTTATTRPGSPGRSALRMNVRPGDRSEIYSFLDSSGAPAGRLLTVNGKWRFSIWLKALAGTPDVRFSFSRGATRFFSQTVQPGSGWQQYDVDFTGSEQAVTGDNDALQLTLSTGGEGAAVAVDDVSLSPVTSGAFKPEVVAMLQRLRPGYLREWQGQLGDTIANRLAPAWQRQSARYHWQEDGNFSYGLDEFVDLCAEVGAMPWLIIPSTVGADELAQLSDFMRRKQQTHHFKRWVLEYGNENWNAMFRPAALTNDDTHAARVRALFGQLKTQLGGVPTQFLINIQPANPDRFQPEAEAARQTGAALATAPYYFRDMASGMSDADILANLFPRDEAAFLQDFARLGGNPLWLYEYNLHTDGGSAGFDERVRAVSGLASGYSLAARAMSFYNQNVVNQSVYSLSQIYGNTRERTVDGSNRIPLWGITRDFSFPTLRPTGLAVQLLNRAFGGDMYRMTCSAIKSGSCDGLLALGFSDGGHTSVAVSNPTATPRSLLISWNGKRLPPTRWQTLEGNSLWVNNENPVAGQANPVNLVSRNLTVLGNQLLIQLPAWGVGVISDRP